MIPTISISSVIKEFNKSLLSSYHLLAIKDYSLLSRLFHTILIANGVKKSCNMKLLICYRTYPFNNYRNMYYKFNMKGRLIKSMGKELKFKNSESLDLVKKLLEEAELTLNDKNRSTADVDGELGIIMDKILKCEIFGVGAAGAGLAVGGIAGVGLLSALGSVTGLSAAGITSGLAAAGGLIGGGMVAGIGVLAAPALILGGGAYAVASKIKQKKLIQEKEMLIQRIILIHDRMMLKLEQDKDATEERLNHLKLIIDMLMGVKKDMESDLND